MCTILVWRGVHPRYPLVVAANRDEFLDRPSRAPHQLSREPLVVGGSDDVAGGTWLAVTTAGFIVALTNRRGARTHDRSKSSRGALAVDVARAPSFDAAAAVARACDASAYNPFAMILADARRAVSFDGGAGGAPGEIELSAGAHAMTNWPLDAESPPIAARAKAFAAAASLPAGDDALVDELHRVLADHGDDPLTGGLCVHREAERYGTRSSAIVLADGLGVARYLHAEGFACQSRFIDHTELVRPQEAAARRRSGDGP